MKLNFQYVLSLLLVVSIVVVLPMTSMAGEITVTTVLELPKAVEGDTCVAPLDEMRRDHMNMLFHQRDRTMYSGERDSKFSLTGCLDCHTQKDTQGHFVPINAPGQFCQQCHDYAAVKIDCFECHATTPRQP